MLRVRDVMTRDPVAVEPWMPLREAAALLSARHVSGVPVVEGGRLLGVVSSTDLLAAAGELPREERAEQGDAADADPAADDWTEGDDPPASYFVDAWERADAASRNPEPSEAPFEPPWERPVEEVMTRAVLTIAPDAPLHAAARVMREAGVHRLLVVEAGRLVGVVSAMDVVRAVAERRVGTRRLVFDPDARFDPRGWARRGAVVHWTGDRPSGEHRR